MGPLRGSARAHDRYAHLRRVRAIERIAEEVRIPAGHRGGRRPRSTWWHRFQPVVGRTSRSAQDGLAHTFGASAPLKELQKKFGFLPATVVAVRNPNFFCNSFN